jgi:hypothetical protein
MRFKLDENLGRRGAEIFHEFGHDVAMDKDLTGKLWIVQKRGIREYQPDN